MDRFIALNCKVFDYSLAYLKSSMDRFIANGTTYDIM